MCAKGALGQKVMLAMWSQTWNALRIMDFSPEDRDCQCQPDIISAAAFVQTYFAQVGLGGGQGVTGDEEEWVLQWFLLFYWHRSFFALFFWHRVYVAESVWCCSKRHSANFNAVKLEPAKESTASSFVSSLSYYSYQSVQIIEKSRLRQKKPVLCWEKKTDEDFRWSWSHGWNMSPIRKGWESWSCSLRREGSMRTSLQPFSTFG